MKKADDKVIAFYARSIVDMPTVEERRQAILAFGQTYGHAARALLEADIKIKWLAKKWNNNPSRPRR